MGFYEGTSKRITTAQFYDALAAICFEPLQSFGYNENEKIKFQPIDPQGHSRVQLRHGISTRQRCDVLLHRVQYHPHGKVKINAIAIKYDVWKWSEEAAAKVVSKEIEICAGVDGMIGCAEVLSGSGDNFCSDSDRSGDVADVILQICVKIGICQRMEG